MEYVMQAAAPATKDAPALAGENMLHVLIPTCHTDNSQHVGPCAMLHRSMRAAPLQLANIFLPIIGTYVTLRHNRAIHAPLRQGHQHYLIRLQVHM